MFTFSKRRHDFPDESCKQAKVPRQVNRSPLHPMKVSVPLLAAALVLLLNACSGHQTALRQSDSPASPTPRPQSSESEYSYWSDQSSDAPLRVRIDLSEQTAYFYRGERKVGQSRVATGRSGHSTPTGSFTILEKVAHKRSSLYGRIYDADGNLVEGDADTRQHSVPEGGRYVGAPMPYWMRLTSSGIGMHVGPIPNPGRPASHGCVRMPREMARTLFTHAPVGTRVVIEH